VTRTTVARMILGAKATEIRDVSPAAGQAGEEAINRGQTGSVSERNFIRGDAGASGEQALNQMDIPGAD
jgi:hypothetical protein